MKLVSRIDEQADYYLDKLADRNEHQVLFII